MKKAVILFLLVCVALFAGCSGRRRLRAFDEIILVGQKATLRAKLEKGGGRDVKGAKIAFEVLEPEKTDKEGKSVYLKLGEAITNSDGMAAIAKEGFSEGTHVVHSKSTGTYAAAAVSRVFVVKPEQPLLVCDIDHTIADVSALKFLTSKTKDIPALPGSVEILKELSKKYLIVYLTQRDDTYLNVTIQWLKLKGFPNGPVFFSDSSKKLFLASAKKFKTAQLAGWKEAGFNLHVGVGDRDEDAKAYLANGMKAFILTDEPEDLPAEAKAVGSWSEIADALAK